MSVWGYLSSYLARTQKKSYMGILAFYIRDIKHGRKLRSYKCFVSASNFTYISGVNIAVDQYKIKTHIHKYIISLFLINKYCMKISSLHGHNSVPVSILHNHYIAPVSKNFLSTKPLNFQYCKNTATMKPVHISVN